MFDCHYDLLTFILMNRENVDKIKEYCKTVFNKNNITGGIFNLFYMSPKEMIEEMKISKDEINVIENLRLARVMVKEYKIIPKNIKYIFGIEGLDYLEKIDDIDTLYKLGLRSTNIVWNNKNKFGGGAKSDEDEGLTKLGEELVKKLVEKKIAIDLSHTNEKTFYGITNLCEKLKTNGYNPIIFASHSNSKAICDCSRNLTDEQIIKIKELGGVVGIVEYREFCINDIFNKCSNQEYEQAYLKQINYLKNLLGDVENISVSTDDMRIYAEAQKYYEKLNVYEHREVAVNIRNLLSRNGYSKGEIEKIMGTNFKSKILTRIL